MQQSEIKQEIREHLSKSFPESALERWFDPLALTNGNGEKHLAVAFPHAFFADWFAQSIQEVFERHLRDFLGPEWVLIYNSAGIVSGNAAPRTETKSLDFPFGAEYTFDNFISNQKNHFPFITAQEVAKNDDTGYNPFIITGASGSGKSHLLKSIGNEICRRKEVKKVFLGTVEDLYNIYNLHYYGKLTEARNSIFEYEHFLVDDLQELSRYKNFQSELIVLFNYFYDNKRQMCFCCSEKIPSFDFLDPKLKSRLEWGLSVNLKEPDMDVRLKFIEKHCEDKKLSLTKEQILDLARRFKDPRFLRGILLKIYAWTQYMHKDLSQEDFNSILKQTAGSGARQVRPETVLGIVADYFYLETEQITGKARTGNIVKARQIAMFICRELMNSSFPALGRMFGGRDHSTALYAVKKVKQLQKVDKEMKKTVEALKKKCLQAAEE